MIPPTDSHLIIRTRSHLNPIRENRPFNPLAYASASTLSTPERLEGVRLTRYELQYDENPSVRKIARRLERVDRRFEDSLRSNDQSFSEVDHQAACDAIRQNAGELADHDVISKSDLGKVCDDLAAQCNPSFGIAAIWQSRDKLSDRTDGDVDYTAMRRRIRSRPTPSADPNQRTTLDDVRMQRDQLRYDKNPHVRDIARKLDRLHRDFECKKISAEDHQWACYKLIEEACTLAERGDMPKADSQIMGINDDKYRLICKDLKIQLDEYKGIAAALALRQSGGQAPLGAGMLALLVSLAAIREGQVEASGSQRIESYRLRMARRDIESGSSVEQVTREYDVRHPEAIAALQETEDRVVATGGPRLTETAILLVLNEITDLTTIEDILGGRGVRNPEERETFRSIAAQRELEALTRFATPQSEFVDLDEDLPYRGRHAEMWYRSELPQAGGRVGDVAPPSYSLLFERTRAQRLLDSRQLPTHGIQSSFQQTSLWTAGIGLITRRPNDALRADYDMVELPATRQGESRTAAEVEEVD